MLVVWVLDTSASMNQRAHGGLTLLDCAKSAMEHFIKVLLPRSPPYPSSVCAIQYLASSPARNVS
jgi:hypothetical protein